MLPKKLSSDEYAFLFSLQEEELCNAFSEQIRKMRTDGTLAELDKKWFSGDESRQVMPPPPSGAPKGVLKYATVPQLEPFTFLRNGQVVGYDIEVAQRIAEKLGYALEPVIMDWGGYLDAIASGKVRCLPRRSEPCLPSASAPCVGRRTGSFPCLRKATSR